MCSSKVIFFLTNELVVFGHNYLTRIEFFGLIQHSSATNIYYRGLFVLESFFIVVIRLCMYFVNSNIQSLTGAHKISKH